MATIHFDITADNEQILRALKQTTDAINGLKSSAESADKKMDLPNAKKSMDELDKATSSAGKSISSSLDSMIRRYTSAAAAAMMLAKVLKQAFQTNADFERKNAELASVLGTTKDGIKELTDAAKELGRTTEFTATNVTELQTSLARLGFSNNQILDMQGAVLKFAAAVNADLGESANFAGSVLRAFEIDAKDTTHMLDILAASTSKSALDFSKLNASMSTIAPVAHAFGLTLEDTVTLLGALSNAGFDASSAATATRNILLNLADANGKLAKGLGHSANSFPEIIAALKECQEKGVDLNSTLEMTDKRSVAAFNALISGADSANELRDSLGNCDGTLDQMYDTMTNNLTGAVRELKSAWEGLLLTFQNSTGPMADVVRGLSDILNKITDFSNRKERKASSRNDNLLNQADDYVGKMYSEYAGDLEKINERIAEDLEEAEKNYNAALSKAATARGKKAKKEAQEQVNLWNEVRDMLKMTDQPLMDRLEYEDRKNGGSKTTTKNTALPKQLTDAELKALQNKRKKAAETLAKAQRDMWKAVDDSTVAAMKEGTKKKLAEIDNDEKQALAAIREEREELEKQAKIAGQSLTQATLDAFKTREENTTTFYQNKRDDVSKEQIQNRLDYLIEYGTYKEKELALTEKYNKAIEEADEEDTYTRLRLEKEKQQALYDLQKEYSGTYALIFADADKLSDSLLKKAIEETQKEIRKASESGDIQKLTELYARLKEQMKEDSERNRDWGFGGITQGFEKLAIAQDKQRSAEVFSALGFQEVAGKLLTEGIDEEQQAILDIQNAIGEVANAFGELGDTLEGFGGVLGEIGSAFSGLASHADDLGKIFTSQMSGPEKISTAISGTLELISMVGQSIANNKKAQEEWNRTIEESEHKLAMLRLEALDYKQQNVFGVENPYKKAIDGATQYAAAMEELNKLTSKLAEGQVQTGTKKVVDWGNVGKGAGTGAAAGAAVGSFFGPWGTAIGAAIGAGIGAITGALSRKTVPIMESLQSQYGQLFNPDTYELNKQLLADYDKLDDATKQIVDNWDEIVAKAKEAEQEMRDNFSNLAGDIGNQLSDSLVEAFRNGELDSAIDDFHQKMTDTIEDILEQLVFSATFGAMFDELEDRMMKSFGEGGDQDIVDDLIWMEEEYQKKLDQYNGAMTDVKDSLNKLGYDVFGANTESSLQTASAGGFQTLSQDTANELNGRFTALQLSNEVISQAAQEGLLQILAIGGMVTTGNATLSEIRNLHILEVGYLEDIAKYTKPLTEFGDKLDKISDNTARL